MSAVDAAGKHHLPEMGFPVTPFVQTVTRPTGCACGNTNCLIPYGECHCGCRRTTPISKETCQKKFLYKGFPARYFPGHSYRTQKTPDFPKDAIPFKIDGKPCRLVPLTKGQYAIVNDSEYGRVMMSEWSALKRQKAAGFYAVSRRRDADGKSRMVYMHRFILGLEFGDPLEGDHIEPMDTLDNRIENLQTVTVAQNSMKQRLQKRRSGRLKGAHKHRNWWLAQIREGGKMIVIKRRCKTELEAHLIYCEEAKRRFGKFARFK